jgi:hypothetical protein
MSTPNSIDTKRIYCSPEIEYIQLDNEIAMQLTSPAVSTEDEVMNIMENSHNNPFKTDIA